MCGGGCGGKRWEKKGKQEQDSIRACNLWKEMCSTLTVMKDFKQGNDVIKFSFSKVLCCWMFVEACIGVGKIVVRGIS